MTKPCSRPLAILTASILLAMPASLVAETYNWISTGGTTDWNVGFNWDPSSAFPNAAGDIANVNSDLTATQTIRLRQDIRLGILNIGDSAATSGNFGFTIANFSGESFALTFDSGVANTTAQLNLNVTGTPASALSVPILLGSDLNINLGAGTQTLSLSATGSLSTGTGLTRKNVTVTGGSPGTNQFTLSGDLTGDGVFTNSGNASVIINGTKSFTGTFVLNKGLGGSNTGSLTVTTGSIAAASEVVINGALSNGVTQSGGILHTGNGSASSTIPGQRLTTNRITLNGGTLSDGGQALKDEALGSLVEDTVSVLDFNSGYSLVGMSASTSSGGTRLHIGAIERSPGATGFLRSTTLADESRFLVTNIGGFLKGGGGAETATNMSIIPWMVAANTNGSAQTADTFATYTVNGVRGLGLGTNGFANEYAATITDGADQNVSAGNLAVPALDSSATVNSLRFPTSGTGTIGTDKTLKIASGGLLFTNNNGGIGIAGDAAAGTLQFGLDGQAVEGVVWSNGANTNRIGAAIAGSGGLSKAGTGTLVLLGDNIYTGLTYVSGGTLQIGDGIIDSNLGLFGDVAVAGGARLSLLNDDAISDGAILTLQIFGLHNGKMSLAADLNETVGGLFFGDSFQVAGTYGSSTSPAMFKNDTFFEGDGVLTVVPEPASAALLLGGIGFLLGRRRRA